MTWGGRLIGKEIDFVDLILFWQVVVFVSSTDIIINLTSLYIVMDCNVLRLLLLYFIFLLFSERNKW